MVSWLNQNGLALYGAITGTAALVVTFFAYRHNVRRERVFLAVRFKAHPERVENIARLRDPANQAAPWDHPQLVQVYQVIVCNTGSVPAPLQDAGVIDAQGNKHAVRVSSSSSNPCILGSLSAAGNVILAPHSAQTFSVYLKAEAPDFEASSAYVTDQAGKVWGSRG